LLAAAEEIGGDAFEDFGPVVSETFPVDAADEIEMALVGEHEIIDGNGDGDGGGDFAIFEQLAFGLIIGGACGGGNVDVDPDERGDARGMEAWVGGLVGIAEGAQVDCVVVYSQWEEGAGHAVEADVEAGVPRKSCAVGVDGHGEDLPGGRLNGDGCTARLKRREAQLGRAAGILIVEGIELKREGDGFIAGAAEADGRIDSLGFEGVVELRPLDAAGGFDLGVAVFAIVVR